jgi:hypothetical protein
MSVIEHVMSVEHLADDQARAHCSCGWMSSVREITTSDDFASLDVEWEDHCDVAFMEATGG